MTAKASQGKAKQATRKGRHNKRGQSKPRQAQPRKGQDTPTRCWCRLVSSACPFCSCVFCCCFSLSCRVASCCVGSCFASFYIASSYPWGCSGHVLGDAFPETFLWPSRLRENRKTGNELEKLDRLQAPTYTIVFSCGPMLGQVFWLPLFKHMHKHVSQV